MKEMNVKAAQEIIEKQKKLIDKSIPQSFVFDLSYGLAWFIGYMALFLTKFSKLGYIIFGSVISLAIIVSVVYMMKKTNGVETSETKKMKWFGVSWILGFAIYSSIMAGFLKFSSYLNTRDAVNQVSWLLGNTIPLMIVSIILINGAGIFKEKSLGILGIIIGIVALVTANMNPETGAIVCAITGAVMLIFALVEYINYKKMEVK